MEWAAGDPGVPRDSRPSVKIILVGSSGVGKTCLGAAYLKGTFDRTTSPTVAPAYSCRTVKRSNGSVVVLQIWDTAGQERYSSISQLFFRDSDVALVCFDPNDQPSVTGVREWVQRILDEVPDCRLFGVLTKADRIEKPEAALEQCRAVLGDLGFEQFFITSALARQGVEAPFTAAAEAARRGGVDSLSRLSPAEGGKSCC
jgi:small GTP-binding protein